MDISKLKELLLKYDLINKVDIKVVELLSLYIDDDEKDKKPIGVTILLLLYFSFLEDGNIGIILDKNILLDKWNSKLEGTQIKLCEEKTQDEIQTTKKEIEDIFDFCKTELTDSVFKLFIDCQLANIVGDHRPFYVDNNWLYGRKYYNSMKRIGGYITSIFKNVFNGSNESCDYDKWTKSDRHLADKQKLAADLGRSKNLIITGKPGTGKTTSIFFVLYNLLKDNPNAYEIYMTAPSGIAADRMKTSLLNSKDSLTDDFKSREETKRVLEKLEAVEGLTIHSLLGFDPKTGGFVRNENNKFDEKSIFIIDEASMIDILLFDNLLSAINPKSRVFILGDKDQLPSVESGAVLASLLSNESLKDNIVLLDKSYRFPEDSEIYNLAQEINSGNLVDDKEFKTYNTFDLTSGIDKNEYFIDDVSDIKEDEKRITFMVDKWINCYYDNYQNNGKSENTIDICTDIEESENVFKNIYSISDRARILCSQNRTRRGVDFINEYIDKRRLKNKGLSKVKNYPSQLLIITKNDKKLSVSNGEKGIVVKFKNDDTLYFMSKKEKSGEISFNEKRVPGTIFKIGEYVFYPLFCIPGEILSVGYAITVHKSQGSDFDHVLIFLPKDINHPLLTRQMVYTAITRTKKDIKLYTNFKSLEKASKTLIVRDTNIVVK